MQTPDDPTVFDATYEGREGRGLSRRQFIKVVSGAGFTAVALRYGLGDGYAFAAGPGGTSSLGTGTVPEQIHLTWGANPSSEVTVSWISPAAETTPQVTISPAVGGQSIFSATGLSYTDGLSGEVVNAYHVPLSGLTPGATYTYTVVDAATPSVTFTSSFTTPGTGRFAYSFTSFGDLGTPGTGATYTLANGTTISSTTYSESQWNAYNAVGEVEALAPLFHLLNGDLCYADKETISSTGATTSGASGVQPAPEVWRDFGLNVQRSAANRPWMPCIGNHEAELDNGPYGYNSYNTRYMLPGNGTSFPGSFYSFQVGSVLFISLDANDVCYQGAGAYNVGGVATTDAEGNPISATAHQYNQFYTGTFTANANGTLTPGGATPNAQTTWLESTLAAARANTTIDWIVVQMHQCALSSSTDNGCDAAIRKAWVPLFDQYQVDLVVNGHDHDYERSYPVRGFTANQGTGVWPGGNVTQASGTVNVPSNESGPVNTFTPVVVSDDETSPFDTTQGTVYMVLGGGGTNKRDNAYGSNIANVTTFTQIRTGSTKPGADSTEPAAWSAMRDTTDAYGVALFSVNPGVQGGNTTITVTYYHAPTQTSGAPTYSLLESFQLTRPRSDNPPADTPEFPTPALAVGGTMALGAGALLVEQHRRTTKAAKHAELALVSRSTDD
jgi:Purple acid Phosphatase, N-terminal domain/Calcineurin-like phosphoesterase